MKTLDNAEFLYSRPVRMRRRSSWLMGVLFLVLLFGGYVSMQANDVLFGPKLIIETPIDGETIDGRVLVSGKTDPNTRLTINGYETFSNENGFFSQQLPLGNGYHDIIVKVKNRFNKERTADRAIIVQCSEWC